MVTTGNEDELACASVTCRTRGSTFRITLTDDVSRRETCFDVEQSTLTTSLVDHLLAPDIELVLLSGVREDKIDCYRHAVYMLLSYISRCQ